MKKIAEPEIDLKLDRLGEGTILPRSAAFEGDQFEFHWLCGGGEWFVIREKVGFARIWSERKNLPVWFWHQAEAVHGSYPRKPLNCFELV